MIKKILSTLSMLALLVSCGTWQASETPAEYSNIVSTNRHQDHYPFYKGEATRLPSSEEKLSCHDETSNIISYSNERDEYPQYALGKELKSCSE